VFKLELQGEAQWEQEYAFMNMTVTEGEGMLNGCLVKKGDHFILPYRFGMVKAAGNMEIIASTV